MNIKILVQNKPFLISTGIVLLSIVIMASILFLPKNSTKNTTKPTVEKTVVSKKTNTKKISVSPTKKIVFIPTATPTFIPLPTNTPVPTATTGPSATPTATPQPADTEAPKTNVYHPQNNGVMSYKFDGRFCVILNPPSDNQSSYNDIGVSYKFDGDTWTEWRYAVAYLCKDTLPNGPHTIAVKSKDKAGNVENEQVINFTVNIEGN